LVESLEPVQAERNTPAAAAAERVMKSRRVILLEYMGGQAMLVGAPNILARSFCA
jgi:hypothetical protein